MPRGKASRERPADPDSLPSSKRPRRDDPSSRNQLCNKCSTIDLDTILSKKPRTFTGKRVKAMGPIWLWAVGSCKLCTLLFTTLEPEKRQTLDDSHNLWSFRLPPSSRIQSDRMGLDLPFPTVISLGASSKYLVAQRLGTTLMHLISPDSIDFESIKDWLSLCREKHNENCSINTTSPVRSMKLIDCETRNLVPSADHPYVALSYVWGANAKPVEYSGSLPKDLPATIEDSVVVTKKLGFRYLWIDQFCIDRNDKAGLAAQLLAMDSIYQNSTLTLIAAAGEDAMYGLPGVGKRRRAVHARSQVGDYIFTSSLHNPETLIEKSAWITRAWTYQEGILSRRRLVFTDEQVYYKCGTMDCCEDSGLRLEDMRFKSRRRFKEASHKVDTIRVFPSGVGHNPWDVTKRIAEYSQRSLTNPSDILSGILGVLRAFDNSAFNVRHYLGVPILPRPKYDSLSVYKAYDTFSWNPKTGMFMGLCWQPTTPSSRRFGFPSWSWTGWSAPVDWDLYDLQELLTDPNVDISFEHSNVIVTYDMFQLRYIELDRSLALSNFIHLSAWTSKIKLLEYDSTKGRYMTRMELEDGGYIHWEFSPTTNAMLSTQSSFIGIHIGRYFEGSQQYITRFGPALLVVEESEAGMERVGFGWIDESATTVTKPDGTSMMFTFHDRPTPEDWDYLRNNVKLVKSWQQIRLG